MYTVATEDKKSYLNFPQTTMHQEDKSRVLGVVYCKIYKKKNTNILWDGKKFTNLGDNAIGVHRGLQVKQSSRDNNIEIVATAIKEQLAEKAGIT